MDITVSQVDKKNNLNFKFVGYGLISGFSKKASIGFVADRVAVTLPSKFMKS